jgi:tRNA A-37 threonylcarbamoyl transferase component Bud32
MSELPLRESPATEPADLVEALWASSGGPPELKSVLADHPQWSARELRDALMVDQQFRWRTSQPWSAEQYLAVLPPAAADDALTLDLIYGECRGRTHSGNPPDLAELVRRFPHLRQRLERQLEIASWFADADGGDSPPGEEDSTDDTDATTIRFGDYDLCEEIARGGMGVIYRARHRKLKRTVALKMIRPERLMRAADVRRFKNETRIIARLDHPNIIPILNVGQVDGIHFFTMRMVQGRDLESRRTEFLSDVRRAARLVWAVAAAIHHAHQHGVLHRDLKPSNVLVDDSGVPYVVDFGLARQGTESHGLTAPDEFLGTPAYAAPEQLQKGSQPLTVAADVYGLGAILYVLITGQPPSPAPICLRFGTISAKANLSIPGRSTPASIQTWQRSA